MVEPFEHIYKTKEKFPNIPILDIFYYDIKGKGMKYNCFNEKRPKFHIYDEESLFSIVPLISDSSSPYKVNSTLQFIDQKLPINIKQYPPVNTELGYYYLRSSNKNIQTINKEVILNLNFNPKCLGCEFCYRKFDQYYKKKMIPLLPEEGINLIKKEQIDFSSISEIAIVTGLFQSEDKLFNHICDVLTYSRHFGFNGRILYLGSQLISSKKLSKLLSIVDLTYVYTVETFSKRNILHPKKSKSLKTCISDLTKIKNMGIKNLQYTYIPGIDSLSVFSRNFEVFSSLAKPHISIFRPILLKHKSLLNELYINNPTFYLCFIRTQFERIHKSKIIGNNLGNLWPFPKAKINKKFFN